MILLDGKNFTSSVDGLDNISLTVGLKDGAYGYSISNDLVFTKDSFKYLDEKIYSNCDGRYQVVKATVTDKCCGTTTQYQINNSTLSKHCNYMTGSLVETSPEKTAYDKLNQNKLIDDDFIRWMSQNGGIQNVTVARITNFLEYLISFQNILDFFDGDFLTVAFYHPTINLNKAFKYWAERCGLGYKSSIFQNAPYNEAVMLSAFAEGPYQCIPGLVNNQALNVNNWPRFSVLQLLDNYLVETFNLEYRFVDGVFCIEKKGYFDSIDDDVIDDIEKLWKDKRSTESPGYQLNTEDACENASFEYSRDSIDTYGNQNLNKYNDVVSWADTPNDFQRDTCDFPVNLSPATGLDEANFGLLTGSPQSIFAGNSYPHSLIMNNGMSFLPKILVLDERRTIGGCELRYMIRRTNQNGSIDYNYPMYFDSKATFPELYKNFHASRDPRSTNQCYLVDSFQYAPDNYCATKKLIIEKIRSGKPLKYATKYGIGVSEQAELSDLNKTVTLTNLKITS